MVQLLVSGLALGSIYGLVAMGCIAIFRTTRVFNFAQGDLLMVAAIIAVSFYTYLHLPLWLAITLTFPIMAVVGIIFERVAIRPVLRRGGGQTHGWIMTTLGAGIILESGANILLSNGKLPFPEYLSHLGGLPSTVKVLGAVVSIQELAILAAAVIIGLSSEWLYEHTWIGKCIKATAYDTSTARLLGIQTSRIVDLSFVLAALLTCAGGVLIAPETWVYPFMGVDFTIKAFAAVVLGGVGSAKGALAGGLLIGVVEAFGSYYAGASAQAAIALVLIFVVLMTRPSGLFGTAALQKV